MGWSLNNLRAVAAKLALKSRAVAQAWREQGEPHKLVDASDSLRLPRRGGRTALGPWSAGASQGLHLSAAWDLQGVQAFHRRRGQASEVGIGRAVAFRQVRCLRYVLSRASPQLRHMCAIDEIWDVLSV